MEIFRYLVKKLLLHLQQMLHITLMKCLSSLHPPISSVCILMGREPMNQMYQCIWDQFLIFHSKIMIQTKQHTEINTRRHSRRETLWYKHVHLFHDKYHLSKLRSRIKYIKMKLNTQQTLKNITVFWFVHFYYKQLQNIQNIISTEKESRGFMGKDGWGQFISYSDKNGK